MSTVKVDLTGKVALVTGGSRGIGRAVAIKLAASGARIVINYVRDRDSAQATLDAVTEAGSEGLLVKGNVSKEEHLDAIFNEIEAQFGQLDILVSNAASGVLRPTSEMTMKHWHWTMDINAGALIPLSQRSVKLFGDSGIILAMSSLGSVRAIPNYALVGASKAALESLVRHMAMEYASKGIRVNCISAGVVDTDALKHFPNRSDILESSSKASLVGRLVTPDDVADVALFLCSPLSEMIHGQTIVVDGGYSILG